MLLLDALEEKMCDKSCIGRVRVTGRMHRRHDISNVLSSISRVSVDSNAVKTVPNKRTNICKGIQMLDDITYRRIMRSPL